MIWAGKLCKTCKPGKCVDCPTDREPATIECPSCGGMGCKHCDNDGSFDLTECPQIRTRETFDFVELADVYEKGLPPRIGGSLDQAQWFVSACRFFWSEKGTLKREMGIDG